jgi:glycosyltransferase involved in cell wall biosynthesis
MDFIPRVSVILPVYNGERYLAESIESVLSQTYTAYEIVVVNDGSQDGSMEIVKRYIGSGRIKYVEQTNQGVANARNTGIFHSSGEFIALLDQDDAWLPDKLEKQIDFMDAHPEVALLHARVACIDGEGRPISCRGWIYVGEEVHGYCAEQLLSGNKIAPLTVLIRRACLGKVGVFNQSCAPADDWDLWLRIAVRFPLGFLDSVVAKYRVHDSNESKKKLKLRLGEIQVMESFRSEYPALVRRMNRKSIELRLISFYHDAVELHTRAGQPIEASILQRKADSIKLRAPWYYLLKANRMSTEKQWRFVGSYWHRIRSLLFPPRL